MDFDLCALFWKGYSLESYDLIAPQHLRLRLQVDSVAFCSVCQQSCLQVHDTVLRHVRDCDLLNYRLSLIVPVRRVNCPDCGRQNEHIDWLSKHQRMTDRLVQHTEDLCRILPIKHVAEHLKLSWHSVKRIDKQRLIRELPPVDWTRLRRLVMDEFALHKGHRYASVIADADTKQVLWIGEGRTRESIRPFFKQLGKHCEQIEAVAMDQNSAFDLEVKAHCPNAEVVYDLFHVVAKYGREVIDRVRVDQANELRADKHARKAVKRSRWLLLKNRDNLSDDQQVRLKELMATNQPLAQVYVLKEQLKELWRCHTSWQAFKQWRSWLKIIKESELRPLMDFARKLKPYLRGILASAKYPLNTSVLEGINNKIKVIKRMAYGFRDNEYFFLKIKYAFLGK